MKLATFILSAVAVGTAAATGQLKARAEIARIFERQVTVTRCTPIQPPYTCERSCGKGFVTCGDPDLFRCYNPTIGEACCKDGSEWPLTNSRSLRRARER